MELLKILSVEDNEGDRYLIERFFKARAKQIQLSFVEDGCEAIDYVLRRGKFQDVATPDLILLDLNLQKKHGREVLKEVKTNSLTKDIPIFVLTTSKSTEDKLKCIDLGAEDFFSKPFSVDDLNETLEYVVGWLEKSAARSSQHSIFQ